MSTIKVDNIDSKDSTGDITVSRPLVATLTAGSISNLNNLLTPANASVTAAKMATTDTLPAWNGSALTNLPAPADNSVTGAKLNISLLAGDTMYASGTDTLAKLAKGTDGEVMTLASGVPSWAAAAGGGKILQVVAVSLATEVTTTSTSYVAVTGMTADITPSATTSKILIMIQGVISHTGSGYGHSVRLYRDSTNIANGSGGSGRENCLTNHESSSTRDRVATPLATMWVDSPSSTSSVTYSLKHRTSGGTAVFGADGTASSTNYGQKSSHITLLEIGV